MTKIELVISRFSEDLSWLKEEPFKSLNKIIYNKGKTEILNKKDISFVTEIKLSNIGRESHTYLNHIIENYDEKEDKVYIFLPGSANDLHKISRAKRVTTLAISTLNSILIGQATADNTDICKKYWNFSCIKHAGQHELNSKLNPSIKVLPASPRPYGEWYRKYFGYRKARLIAWNSIFAIHSSHIKQHSKEYYISLMNNVNTHVNPEAGHFFERSWAAVFGPLPEKCLIDLNGSKQNSNIDSNGSSNSSSNSSSNNRSNKRNQDQIAKVVSSSKNFSDMLSQFKIMKKNKEKSNTNTNTNTNGNGNDKSKSSSNNNIGDNDDRFSKRSKTSDATINITSTSNSTISTLSSSISISHDWIQYIIIGTQKGGTMAAVENLNRHPNIFCLKEPHFFDQSSVFQRGLTWYKDILNNSNTSNKLIIGEKTPELIYIEDSLPRIKEICPNVKFILFLRDPIKRAYSNWSMMVGKNREELSFDEAISRELKELMNEKRSYGTSEYHYIQKGFYMDQIERFLKIFPDKSKLLIVISERVRNNGNEEYNKIFSYLNADSFQLEGGASEVYVGSYTKGDKMNERCRKRLAQIYETHNKRLFEWLGYDIPEWISSSSSSSSSNDDGKSSGNK